ncbi:hypothetical protein [Alloactinosynnema sp. L-07]|nr:hypothetical protein [Alloactinosynnema sp. L-07]
MHPVPSVLPAGFSQADPATDDEPSQLEADLASDPAAFASNLIDQLGFRVRHGTLVDHLEQLVASDEPTWRGDPAAAVRVLISVLANVLAIGARGCFTRLMRAASVEYVLSVAARRFTQVRCCPTAVTAC